MPDIAQLGIQVQTQGVDQASTALDKLTAAAERAAKATDGFASNANRIKTATGSVSQGFQGASQAVNVFQAFLGGLIGGTVVAATTSIMRFASTLGEVAKQAIALAMESERMGIAVRVVGTNAGWTTEQTAKLAAALRAANIPTSQADENMVRLAASGLTAAQSQQLLTAAMNLSVPAGQSVGTTLDRLSYAIATGNQYALRSLRIHADFESALNATAAAASKDVSMLSEEEVAVSRLNAVLQAASGYAGVYAEAQDTAATRAEALRVAWEDLLQSLGTDVLPGVTMAIEELTNFLEGMRVLLDDVKNTDFVRWMSELLTVTDDTQRAAGRLLGMDVGGWANSAVQGIVNLLGPMGTLLNIMREISALGGATKAAAAGAGVGELQQPGSINPLAPRYTAAGVTVVGSIEPTAVTQMNASLKATAKDLAGWAGTVKKGRDTLDRTGKAIDDIHEKLGLTQDAARKYATGMANLSKLPPGVQQAVKQQMAAFLSEKTGKPYTAATLPEVGQLLAEANKGAAEELKRIAQRGKKKHGGRTRDENEEALDRATLEELRAQEGLSHDVEVIALVKHKEAEVEFAQQQERLKELVKSKAITQSTADAAAAIYERAKEAKDQLIDLEKQQEADKRALDYAREIAGYQDRADRAYADMAGSVEDRTTVEERALERRQATERAELEHDIKWKLKFKEIDEAQAIRLRAELQIAQAAEKEAKARQDAAARSDENYRHQLAMIDIQQTSLGYAESAAGSYREASDLARQQLLLQFEARRLQDQQVIARERELHPLEETALAQEKAADLARIEVDQRNALQAALGKSTDIYNKIAGNLSGLSDAVKSHDWVRVFDLLDEAITKLTDVMREGSGASTGQKAGAIGGLISGLGGAFGMTGLKDIGGIIAVIGKISDLMSGVAEKQKATAVTQESMSKGLDFLGGTGAGTFSGGVDRMTAGMDNLVSALGQAASQISGAGGGFGFGGPGTYTPGLNYNAAFNFSGTFDDVTRKFVQIANQSQRVYTGLGQMTYGTQTTTGGLGNMTEGLSGSMTGLGNGGAIGAVSGFSDAAVSGAYSLANGINAAMSSISSVIGSIGGMAGGGGGGIGGIFGAIGGIAKGLSGGLGGMFGSFTSFMTVGLPVIGTAIGLISSLFGDDDAEKNAEAQKRLAEAQRLSQQQMETMQKRQQLEIDLLKAMDKSEEAVALQRKLELAALDATLQPLQQMIWTLTDLHETLDKAKAVLGRALERDLDAAVAAVAEAHQALVDSYESELQTVQDIADGIDELHSSLTDFQKELNTSPDILGLSPAERYKQAQQAFANANMETAEAAGREFIAASRAYYGSTAGYYTDVANVRKGIGMVVSGLESQRSEAQKGIDWLKSIARNQGLLDKDLLPIGDAVEYLRSKIVLEDTARRQLETLDAQYNLGLVDHDINIAILDAVNRVAAAQEAYSGKVTEAQPLMGLGKTMTQWMAEGHEFDPILYLGMHPDVLAEAKHQLETADPASPSFTRIGLDKGIAGYAAWHWEHYGKAGGYQHGGSFRVRGSGAQDRFVPSWFAPGETVTVSRPGEIEEMNRTLETLVSRQDAIIIELKADKNQRAAIAKQAQDNQESAQDQLQRIARGVSRINA